MKYIKIEWKLAKLLHEKRYDYYWKDQVSFHLIYFSTMNTKWFLDVLSTNYEYYLRENDPVLTSLGKVIFLS